jgi:hypothetical protein
MKTYSGVNLEIHASIESLGRTDGTPDSCSEDTGFVSHPENELS